MVALYVVSAEEADGRTTVCAGLGKHLLDDGKRVGFLKLGVAGNAPTGSDGDASFMKQILALPEPEDSLCPQISDEGVLAKRVKEAYDRVSRGKDVVIIEGMCGQSPDNNLSKESYEIAETLKAKVVIVEDYHQSPASQLIKVYQGFGENLLGIVLNKVPVSQLKRVAEEVFPQFEQAGISVLGELPEDRVLFALTVGELASHIQGKILNNAEKSEELVENIMAGAMCVDSGLDYFGRKTNKAVIVGDDHPDMQMAALETSVRCLVVSGDAAPIDYVRYRAEEKGVPIILTKSDTNTIVESVEEALDKAKFNQERKLVKLAEIMKQHLNVQDIYKGLGLAK